MAREDLMHRQSADRDLHWEQAEPNQEVGRAGSEPGRPGGLHWEVLRALGWDEPGKVGWGPSVGGRARLRTSWAHTADQQFRVTA